MSTVRSDTYWNGIRIIVGSLVGSFLLYMIAYGVRGVPEDADLSFATYPVVTAFVAIFGIVLFVGALPFCYCVSKDKAELAEEFDDVNRRHWITVGLLSWLTAGIYPLWYVYARYRKVPGSGETEPESPGEDTDLENQEADAESGDDTATAGTGREGSDDDEPAETRQRARRAVATADDARRCGEYDDAVAAYEEAVEEYERAKRRTDDGSPLAAAIESDLADAEEKLAETRVRLDRIDAVREPLKDAESSLQTAVAEHVQNERIPARRDYRQAKDHYERALAAIDDYDGDVFGDRDLTVPIDVETSPLPEKLAEWARLPDSERDTLSEAGIGTLTELDSAGERVIADLEGQGDVDAGVADRLRAATWWNGDDERTFTSRKAVERQRDRAEDGREMLR